MENNKKFKHESFGKVSFSKVSGNNTRFFGSDLPQNNYIDLEISGATIERTLTQDWYYADESLIRVRLSSGQFSELLTNMNSGGVCCTIERFNNKKVEPLPMLQNRKELVQQEFEERMKNFQKTLEENQKLVVELSKKKTLNKSDSELLTNTMSWITTEITSNIPFLSTCFQENMDTIVSEAKLEVENAIQHKINVLGKEALVERKQQNFLD